MCVSESMSEVAPFGDVPDKLSAPLKRSFVASRTYVQALKIAGDILANVNKVCIVHHSYNAYSCRVYSTYAQFGYVVLRVFYETIEFFFYDD